MPIHFVDGAGRSWASDRRPLSPSLIIAEFSLRDKVESANLNEEDLGIIQAVLAEYIGQKLDELSVDRELFEDYRRRADGELPDEKDASTVMLIALWEKLKQTHRLTVEIYGHLIPSSNRGAVNRLDSTQPSATSQNRKAVTH